MSFLSMRHVGFSLSCAAVALALGACSGAGVAGDDGLGSSGNASGGGDSTGKGAGNGAGGGDGPSVTVGTGSGAGSSCNGAGCFTDNPTPCDTGLALDDGDPINAAKAMGICQTVATDGYGLVDAKWVRANGTPTQASQQVGILDNFGSNVPPLEGQKVLSISSGHARLPGQPGACGTETCTAQAGQAPPGFPQDVPNCAGDTAINDDIGLEVHLKAPTNATGFRYRFKFYSFEFPEYVCTSFNDQYIALVAPAPAGAINGNISFDSATNPVSVNIAFFDVCNGCSPWAENCQIESFLDPSVVCPPEPTPCCPAGPAGLAGTGFDQWASQGAGGTSWLETQAPITAGQEFTIRFAIWDTGDQALDSTAVLDDFKWLGTPGVNTGTGEVPN